MTSRRSNVAKSRYGLSQIVAGALLVGIVYFSIRPFLMISFENREAQQLVPLEQSVVKLKKNLPNDEIYIVFSTSCTPQQNWESYVLFYHCWRLRQTGTITRIASGCTDQNAKELREFHNDYITTLSPHFHLHLTPDFSRVHLDKGKFPYKYNNKPYGLLHWFENGPLRDNLTDSNALLILMDPDMILLRPITSSAALAADESLLWIDPGGSIQQRLATSGPISQQDGYLNNAWMKLVPQVLSPDYSVPESRQGPMRWNSGPPYLGTISDWYNLTHRWTKMAGPVLAVHPHLFAEMFSLIIAAVDLDKPFTMAASFVVSTTMSTNREGWKWIDALEDPCAAAQHAVRRKPEEPIPTLPYMLHYCKRYGIGRYFFSKYRVKKAIVSCDAPLMTVPNSNDVANATFTIFPPRADGKDKDTYVEKPRSISEKVAKRETFMVCGMTAALNEALLHFKKQACSGGKANLNATYMIIDDPGS